MKAASVIPSEVASRLRCHQGVTVGVSTSTYNGDGDRIAQTVDSVETTYLLDTAVGLTMVLSETTGEDTIYYLHGAVR